MRQSLTEKVLLAALVFFLIILGVAAFGISNLLTIGPITNQLSERTITELDLADQFHINLARAGAEAKSFALGAEDEDLDQAHAALSAAEANLTELARLVATPSVSNTVSQQERQELNQERQALLTTTTDLIGVVETSEDEENRADAAEELEQLEEELERLDAVTRQHIDRTKADAIATTNGAIQRGIYGVGIAFGLIVLLVVLAVFLLRRHIVAPLNILAVAAQNLSAGGSDRAVPVTSQDEIGDLQTAFNQMTATIREQTRDLEAQVTTANTARREAEQAQRQIADQLSQIQAQNNVIREMSVPILPLTSKTLVIPLVGALDTARLMLLQEQALHAIQQASARYLLLDITGISVVDSQVAQGFIKVIQASRLLGTEVILVGIRPEVAQSIISLGVQMGEVVTRSTLESGMAYVLGQRPTSTS